MILPQRTPEHAKLSLVVPVFNEEVGLPSVAPIIIDVMEALGYPFEVVVSDNGSTDNTEAIMQELAQKDSRWKYIRLSRNFGYQNNISLGMRAATGDAIMVIDSDLQDPPELLKTFVEHWQQGYDVVYGVREKRIGEPRLRVMMTMFAMNLIKWMADYPLPAHSADFRLIDKKVQAAFREMDESSRFVRGMVHWIGYKQIGIPYTRGGRQYDQEQRKWGAGVLSLTNTMLDAIFSFSLKPLRLFSLLGVLILLTTLMMSLGYIALRVFQQNLPPGFTTQLVVTLSAFGVNALGIGVLGEYIGRIYMQSKERPLWVIDYTLNFDKGDSPVNVSEHQTDLAE